MKNIEGEIKYELLDETKIPIWEGSYEILLSKLRQEIWAELYQKTTNQIYDQVFLPIRDQVWLQIDNPKKLKIKL